MEFKEGQTVTLYVSEIKEVNEEKFIFLSDGYKDTYRVLPFDFQLDLGLENLPRTLKCFVKSVNIHGWPFLQQSRKDILETCYTDFGTEFPFKIIAISEPEVSPKHYILKDSFGIRHRYYPGHSEPDREVNDIFSLLVVGIAEKDGNRSHLDFRAVETGIAQIEKGDDVPIDPRIESKFGVEGSRLEFKSTIVFPAGGIEPDIDKQIWVILKTIAAFQNSEGGILYIGVNDTGTVVGIEYDFPYLNTGEKDIYKNYTATTDHYELKIRNAIRSGLGPYANSNVSFEFIQEGGKTYCKITVNRTLYPVFRSDSKLFQRAGNMIQILQKDEITWFVEERMRLREGAGKEVFTHFSKNIIQVEKDEIEEVKSSLKYVTDSPSMVAEPLSNYASTKKSNEPDKRVWYWMIFYKDGTWSYADNQLVSDKIMYQLPIIHAHKKERLFMVYKNGCVNVVNPYEIIMPKSARGGRTQKTKSKIYQNGWNTKSEIVKIYTASKEDYIFFRSKQADGNEWIKVHQNNAISVHTGLSLEGNVLINSKFKASLEQVEKIENAYFPVISSLVLKNHQTSGYLGFRTNESAIKLAFNTIEKILEKQNS